MRAGQFRYDADNVIVYEIVKNDGYVHFSFLEFASEYSHLREPDERDDNTREQNVKELLDKGKSYRDIAATLGISKSLVGKIAAKLKSMSTVKGEDAKDVVDAVDGTLL